MTGMIAAMLLAQNAPADFTAHEWGTFTSVVGSDGVDLEWRPLASQDLPAFVYGVDGLAGGRGLRVVGCSDCLKCKIAPRSNCECQLRKVNDVRLRMETPVLYFYADREIQAEVRVEFQDGRITEWYPRVRATYWEPQRKRGVIDWGRFTILPTLPPGASIPGRRTGEVSDHYYHAREVDAAYVRFGWALNDVKQPAEYEKFLFYRGVGNLTQPLKVRAKDDHSVEVSNFGRETVNRAFVLAVRAGRTRFQRIESIAAGGSVTASALGGSREELARELEQALVAEGLYPKEARAMLATWNDSYFEEGVRVLYLVPRPLTDAILPITIRPQPKELVRVLVGRIECVSSELEAVFEGLVRRLDDDDPRARDAVQAQLARFGRFAEAFLKRSLQTAVEPEARHRIEHLLRAYR